MTNTFRILVSGKDAGAVIGQKGMNIVMLREMFDYRTSVTHSVPGVSERVVTLSGALAKFGQCIEFLAEKIIERDDGNGKFYFLA